MPTLVLTTRRTVDAQALWRAAIDEGWEVAPLSTLRHATNAKTPA